MADVNGELIDSPSGHSSSNFYHSNTGTLEDSPSGLNQSYFYHSVDGRIYPPLVVVDGERSVIILDDDL